jgi:hypothetical protein
LRDSFFAARRFHSLDDLNAQLADWTERVAHVRIVPGDAEKRTVAVALAGERPRLLPLPAHRLDCDAVCVIRSGKTPYVRFDRNDYSIPHAMTEKPLTLVASDLVIRVLDGDDDVAVHKRSWERGRQIEDPRHLEGLADQKRHAHEHRGRTRLMAACTSAEPFLQGVALHGGHLGGTTHRLLRLLDQYGSSEMEWALGEAHRRGAFAAQSVGHILDQRRRARGVPVAVPAVLPDDPRVRDMVVPRLTQGTDYDVEDETLAPVADEDQPLQALASKALAARPEMATLDEQCHAQEATLRAAEGGYGPTLSAATGASEIGLSISDLVPNWFGRLILNVPIFQGGLTTAQMHTAEAGLESIRAQRSVEELQVRLDVDSARLAVRAAKATIPAADEGATSDHEQLRLAEQRYATGVGSIIELNDAQVAFTSAAAQAVQAHYRLAAARAQLLAALGRL